MVFIDLIVSSARTGRQFCQRLEARHLIDDTVSFMHPDAPISLEVGTSSVSMEPLFSVQELPPEDEMPERTHFLTSTLQLGSWAPVDIGFEMCRNEFEDDLAEHIDLDDVGDRTLVVRFWPTDDGGVDCDYFRIDVPIHDAMALLPNDVDELWQDSQNHQEWRDYISDEMIGAARRARAPRRRKRTKSKRRRRGRKGLSKMARRAKSSVRGAAKRTRARASAVKRSRTKTAQRKTAQKGLKSIVAKGRAQKKAAGLRPSQAAGKRPPNKPLPPTPKQKAAAAKGKPGAKPTGAKPVSPAAKSTSKPRSKTAAAKPKPAQGKKKMPAKPMAKPKGKMPGLGLPGGGEAGGGAAETGGPGSAGGAPEGGAEGGGGAMGPVFLPAGNVNQVPPRAAFIHVVPQPMSGSGPLVQPATVFESPTVEESEFGEEGEEEEEEEGAEQIGDDIFDYDDDDEEEDDYDDDDEEEWLADEMTTGVDAWATHLELAPHELDRVRRVARSVASTASCDQASVYAADIAAALY